MVFFDHVGKVKAFAGELFAQVHRLTSVGRGSNGVTRQSYGHGESAAMNVIQDAAKTLGLHAYHDRAANLIVEAKTIDSAVPAIWIGSHLDSVPNGGNYDGLAGVIAGLLIVHELGKQNPPVKLIALRGEESAWFGVPYIGSKALFGGLYPRDLDRRLRNTGYRDAEIGLFEAMQNCGADAHVIAGGLPLVDPKSFIEFWELHIEQGPVLVAENKPVGVVTAIRGNIRHNKIVIHGAADHSGTTPHHLRKDAVFAFAQFISKLDGLEKEIRTTWPGCHADLVITSGIVHTDATVNAITRIPERVEFCLEWRSIEPGTLHSVQEYIEKIVIQIQDDYRVRFEFDKAVKTPPAYLDEKLATRAMMACVVVPKVTAMKMPSGAGHDAAIFAAEGIPSGMIFVRNANGSHNPNEAMDLDDFMMGVEVLHQVVFR